MPILRSLPLLLPLLAVLPTEAGPIRAPRVDEVAELVTQLRQQRDMAEVEVVLELGNKRSREAMEGLLEVYDVMESIFMRREVVRALALMDGVSDAEQPALQKIMDVATSAVDRELRLAAVDSLAGCRNLGKAFLAMIVEAPAEDDVRELALSYHVATPRPEDMAWYRNFYRSVVDLRRLAEEAEKEQGKGGKNKGEEEVAERPKVPHVSEDMRAMAFRALLGELNEEELLGATTDFDSDIRIDALYELEQRGFEGLEELAERYYMLFGQVRDRVAGARVRARLEGTKLAKEFIKDASRADTEPGLRAAIAEILGGFGDERIDADLIKLVGKGKPHDKLFALAAVRDIESEKLDKRLLGGLKDKSAEVRFATLELMGHRRWPGCLKDVEKLAEKTKDPLERAAALDTIAALKGNDPEWVAHLEALSLDENLEVRNTALRQLGATGNPDVLPTLVEALSHEQWSTRVMALEGIEGLYRVEGIGPVIARMAEEEGRILTLFGEALFRLTGQPFGKNPQRWAAWWAEGQADFSFPSPSELKRKEREAEDARLKQISRTEFFGIRIDSHRVTFIIDVSGSMEEYTRGRYRGEQGETRIVVAKRELIRCLDSIDRRSLFNIITFSGDAQPWQDSIQEYTSESIAAAKAFVEKILAGGGTNLFDSLELAFSDPDVDTIFILSDGEPTAGSITQPGRIRNAVAAMNKNRGVTIHCIAVGGSLDILEWLAEDTGGTYLKHP